jgi:hypothetical protein
LAALASSALAERVPCTQCQTLAGSLLDQMVVLARQPSKTAGETQRLAEMRTEYKSLSQQVRECTAGMDTARCDAMPAPGPADDQVFLPEPVPPQPKTEPAVPAVVPPESAPAPPPARLVPTPTPPSKPVPSSHRAQQGPPIHIIEVGDWPAADGSVNHHGIDVNREGTTLARDNKGGLKIEHRVVLKEAEAVRQAWKKRGGFLGSMEAVAGLTIGGGSAGPCDIGIFGFNLMVKRGALAMSPPVIHEKKIWTAFRFGAGAGFQYNSRTTSCGSIESDSETAQMQIPVYLGFQLGLGGFGDDGEWRGAVLGLDYQPSVTIPFTEGDISFNEWGVNFTLDFVSLEAALDAIATEAHFRITGSVLPLGDLISATISIGVVTY